MSLAASLTTPAQVSLPRAGCTLLSYAEAKRLPASFIEALGVAEVTSYGSVALRVPYRRADGTAAAVRLRTALVRSAGKDDRFRWERGSKPLLYGLWRLGREPSVVIVEGESDCHTLWHHGINAVGLPGAGL